jgi:hypothetical protein
MEPLYEIFCHNPLREVMLWGAIALIAVGAVLIFKIRMKKPKKKE